MGTQLPSHKGHEVEVENFEIGPEVGALLVIANFVALEQQRILVNTISESL